MNTMDVCRTQYKTTRRPLEQKSYKLYINHQLPYHQQPTSSRNIKMPKGKKLHKVHELNHDTLVNIQEGCFEQLNDEVLEIEISIIKVDSIKTKLSKLTQRTSCNIMYDTLEAKVALKKWKYKTCGKEKN